MLMPTYIHQFRLFFIKQAVIKLCIGLLLYAEGIQI